MARRLVVLCLLAAASLPVFAKDVYLAVAGSVGVFRTDTRIFNPSQTKDIQIQAYYLPAGGVSGAPDNSGVQPRTITIAKRQMAIYNDVVSSLFQSGGLGGIRLSSEDDFIATQRIYAVATNAGSSNPCSATSNPCTLGQFVDGVDGTNAKAAGVLIQLGVGTANRTNIGVLNSNNATANVSFRVYDKNNVQVGQTKTLTLAPYAVVQPRPLAEFATNLPTSADLTDAWVGYTSNVPVIAYASVVDNGSTDQTYIPAATDPNPPPNTPPVTTHTFDVTLRSFSINIAPIPSNLKVGDQVTMRVEAADDGHGFKLVDQVGTTVVADRGLYPSGQVFTYNFTLQTPGGYAAICTQVSCGSGHGAMILEFSVGAATDAAAAELTAAPKAKPPVDHSHHKHH